MLNRMPVLSKRNSVIVIGLLVILAVAIGASRKKQVTLNLDVEVSEDDLVTFVEMGLDLTEVSSRDLLYLIARIDEVDTDEAKKFVEVYKKVHGIRCSECGETLKFETDGDVLMAKANYISMLSCVKYCLFQSVF